MKALERDIQNSKLHTHSLEQKKRKLDEMLKKVSSSSNVDYSNPYN